AVIRVHCLLFRSVFTVCYSVVYESPVSVKSELLSPRAPRGGRGQGEGGAGARYRFPDRQFPANYGHSRTINPSSSPPAHRAGGEGRGGGGWSAVTLSCQKIPREFRTLTNDQSELLSPRAPRGGRGQGEGGQERGNAFL